MSVTPGMSLDAFISPDGRYVGFYSDATNLVANDTNGRRDVFVRDRLTETTGSLTIWEPAPVANFTGTPTSGPAPLTVQFNDTSSRSPTYWLWDFGDGSNSKIQSLLTSTFNIDTIHGKERKSPGTPDIAHGYRPGICHHLPCPLLHLHYSALP